MKIFYVTADFDLTEKPSWLDVFRVKYDDEYVYHITLKQATFFEEDKLSEIESKINTITSNFEPIPLTFTHLATNKTPKGHVVMVMSEPSKPLLSLQKNLHKSLSPYGEITKDYYKAYELQFEPHITIARHLSDEQLAQAQKEIIEPISCKAVIETIVLKVNAVDTEDGMYPEYTKDFNLKYLLE